MIIIRPRRLLTPIAVAIRIHQLILTLTKNNLDYRIAKNVGGKKTFSGQRFPLYTRYFNKTRRQKRQKWASNPHVQHTPKVMLLPTSPLELPTYPFGFKHLNVSFLN